MIAGEDVPEGRAIGIWGQRHLRYIRKHKVSLYAELLTAGKLNDYLADLNEQAEAMKPGRKKKIPYEPVEIRVIRHCLVDWKNREISQGNDVASEVIGELLCLL